MAKDASKQTDSEWTCPALPANVSDVVSSTYHHAPKMDTPVIMGVDEAGRGPVLGPMVYAVAYCPVEFKENLAELNYDDSKVLTAQTREHLMKTLVSDPELTQKIGWATRIMTATDISVGMLRPGIPYNLNDQAHDATMALIQLVLDSGVDIAELYVDTVGPPDKYRNKLAQRFPSIGNVVVTKKADSLFPIVSCASICAKVTRDASLSGQLTNCGSGYPADPNTTAWLASNLDRVFGWGPLVRYSWGTAKTLLEDKAYRVRWESEAETTKAAVPTGVPKLGVDFFGSPY